MGYGSDDMIMTFTKETPEPCFIINTAFPYMGSAFVRIKWLLEVEKIINRKNKLNSVHLSYYCESFHFHDDYHILDEFLSGGLAQCWYLYSNKHCIVVLW